ncbi:hypothetical protein HMPREF9418_1681 [Neisseria macacae ATCC 33926]|uniref:Uncharacterized protein n=1 Tax=Neisseria macacae ATCC 33926 TaxID=997348 RepID=A0AA36UIM8_9NEIS|nr:hypothetical protein HMPREF9418_1681 [Neisseria macacae ATCC 33926]
MDFNRILNRQTKGRLKSILGFHFVETMLSDDLFLHLSFIIYSGLNLNQDKVRQRHTGLNLIHYKTTFPYIACHLMFVKNFAAYSCYASQTN